MLWENVLAIHSCGLQQCSGMVPCVCVYMLALVWDERMPWWLMLASPSHLCSKTLTREWGSFENTCLNLCNPWSWRALNHLHSQISASATSIHSHPSHDGGRSMPHPSSLTVLVDDVENVLTASSSVSVYGECLNCLLPLQLITLH